MTIKLPIPAELEKPGRAITVWLHHEQMGYNYRLSELHSALGVSAEQNGRDNGEKGTGSPILL